MRMHLNFKWRAGLVILVVLAALSVFPGASLYYDYKQGRACSRCHEIWQPYTDWHSSAHRNAPCSECHGDVFTWKAGFHLNNMRRVFQHLNGKTAEKPRLRAEDIGRIVERCRQCHQQEFADWRSGPHSVTYADIFLDAKHNRQELLIDDCLRCHGMHYPGAIRELVTPVNTNGPWQFVRPQFSAQPAVPCLACHRVHREGAPLVKSKVDEPISGPKQEIVRPSIALFDRRSQDHVALSDLPMPVMIQGTRMVQISPDQRQALCYQCHAPRPERQVNSGDDRTPIGVHEGLSCLACHSKHGERTRASCATCHPRLSNCGLAVETMDTTFKDKASKHNIHSVKCADCHTKGVPRRRKQI
jgi:hypothetical protein